VPAAGAGRTGGRLVTLLLGLDVGTTSTKAAVIDLDGNELAHGRAPMPWTNVPTGAEIAPEALLSCAVDAAREALETAGPGRRRRRLEHGRDGDPARPRRATRPAARRSPGTTAAAPRKHAASAKTSTASPP
jgi:hypothetical protein